MTSKVQIANSALQRLGVSQKLESLTQNHPNARTMNLAFEPTRKALLRKYDWGFAIRRDSIAADGDQTLWGEHNRFVLPNDYIRLIRDDESGQRVDWKIESAEGVGVYVVTDDASPLEIRYLADVIDPNFYDSTFVEALECALAMKTCKEITGSSAAKESIKDDFDVAIASAKHSGAIEKDAQDSPEDDWIRARN
jgi:hypothetical protein